MDAFPRTSCFPDPNPPLGELDLLGKTFFAAQEAGHDALGERILDWLRELSTGSSEQPE